MDRSNVAATVWIDRAVGVLYNYLSQKGLLENTVIMFTGDNGFAKGSVMELGLRVPLIARGAGIPAGSVVDDLVSFVDLAPTIMDLAGVTGDYDSDGISFASLVQGESSAAFSERTIFGEIATARAAIR
jgi:arylsulfatase A-like enzyme